MSTVLRIRNWEHYFETPESMKRVRCGSWVAIPNKHEGCGYRRIMAEPDGRMIYGVWCALAQTASKMRRRGLLADLDGPLSIEDLATKIIATDDEVKRTIAVVTMPRIGWMDTLEWDESTTFDENVSRLTKSGQLPLLPVMRDGKPSGMKRKPAENSAVATSTVPNAGQNSDSSVSRVMRDGKPSGVTDSSQVCRETPLHNITEQDITMPPAVPQGDKAHQHSAAELISTVEEAKPLICERILKGKDPSRPWSYDAMQGLVRLLPLPRAEIEDIARWRSIPKDDEVPALKFRKEPITETGLMQFWGDELHRAREYLKKIDWVAKKKESPRHWRELFLWLSDNPETLFLPDSFWKLGRDQQQEYHRNIEAFQKHLDEPSSAARQERAPA